jgi:NADH-quinone oxidoreductase subunit E
MDEKLAKVKQVIISYKRNPNRLLPILQEVQEIYSFLPETAMEYVARELGITPGQVFGAATFYAHFTLEPKGKYVIRVCDGTACHVRKSSEIIKVLRGELKLGENKRTSDDGLFTLEIVACLGTCMLAPVLMIGDEVHGSMTREKTIEVLNRYREKEAENA